jgi:hypothetical protein
MESFIDTGTPVVGLGQTEPLPLNIRDKLVKISQSAFIEGYWSIKPFSVNLAGNEGTGLNFMSLVHRSPPVT